MLGDRADDGTLLCESTPIRARTVPLDIDSTRRLRYSFPDASTIA